MKQLAILGGNPVIKEKIKFSHPQIRITEEFISSDLFSFSGNGIVERMEDLFAHKFGFQYTLACNSGTSALFSIYYSAGLSHGDKVLVHAYTFFASALPLFILGCEPILVDVNSDGNISIEDLEKKYQPDVKGLIITHIWGIPADMDKIEIFCKKHNILLFEDCSHAHGASYKGKTLGTFGHASAWSLGAKKNITGGQGGILATKDKKIYEAALLIGHSHEFGKKEITLDEFQRYKITGSGLNLRIHPFAASIIAQQIENFDKAQKSREENANFLMHELSKIEGLSLPCTLKDVKLSWYAFPILYSKEKFKGLSRNHFVRALNAEGASSIDYPISTCPLNSFPIFSEQFKSIFEKKLIKNEKTLLPNAEKYHSEVIKLPVFYGENSMNYTKQYIDCIKKVVLNYSELL